MDTSSLAPHTFLVVIQGPEATVFVDGRLVLPTFVYCKEAKGPASDWAMQDISGLTSVSKDLTPAGLVLFGAHHNRKIGPRSAYARTAGATGLAACYANMT